MSGLRLAAFGLFAGVTNSDAASTWCSWHRECRGAYSSGPRFEKWHGRLLCRCFDEQEHDCDRKTREQMLWPFSAPAIPSTA